MVIQNGVSGDSCLLLCAQNVYVDHIQQVFRVNIVSLVLDLKFLLFYSTSHRIFNLIEINKTKTGKFVLKGFPIIN